MFVSVWRAPVDTSVAASQVQVDTYVVWAYVAATTCYPANLSQMTPAELCDVVRSRTATWHPGIRSLINHSEMGSVNLIALRTMPHLSAWSPSRVTLLGDAIHNMTPMAGVGANTALRDAHVLTGALTAASKGDGGLVTAVAGYEQQMRAYANAAVAQSARNARNAVDPSRFKRRTFRAVLRAAQAIPALKAVVFPAGR